MDELGCGYGDRKPQTHTWGRGGLGVSGIPPPCLRTMQAGCKVDCMASGLVDMGSPEVNSHTVGDARVLLARSRDPVSGPQ